MFSRRDFVKGGVALVSIGTGANSLLKGAVAFAAQNPQYVAQNGSKKTLILVQMAGVNVLTDPHFPLRASPDRGLPSGHHGMVNEWLTYAPSPQN